MGKSAGKVMLTKRIIESAQPDPAKRLFIYDAKVPGLALMVTPNGHRGFYLVCRIGHRSDKLSLGAYPKISLGKAREDAMALNGRIASGEDPRKAAHDGAVLEDVFARYLELHAKPHKRTWKQDEWCYKKHLTPLHKRRLSEIDREAVERLHGRIGRDSGHYQANRTLALLSTIFSFAKNHGWSGENPCSGVKKFPEHSRDRFLDAAELPRLLEALRDEPDQLVADAFRIALLTGARRSNVQRMKWLDIDFARAVWTIPACEFKTNREKKVILSSAALAVLKPRHEACTGSPYVFPSWGESGHLTELKRAWARILEAAKIRDARIHDLRRTHGSWLAAGNVSERIIGAALGHSNPATTRIYARLNLDPVRAAVEQASAAMMLTVDPPSPVAEQPPDAKKKRRKQTA